MAKQQTISSNNTTISTTMRNDGDNYTQVTLHSTVVVQFRHDSIILNSGNWRTTTTKTRMNQASNQFGLGYHVYQKDYDWFVEYRGQTILFQDHMVLNRAGPLHKKEVSIEAFQDTIDTAHKAMFSVT